MEWLSIKAMSYNRFYQNDLPTLILFTPEKMRYGIAFFAIMVLAAAETYNTGHDDGDLQALVSNTEALKSFLDCFTDKQPCNEIQQSFKEDLAEAVQQACAKCTIAQKCIARSFMAAVQEKLPNEYSEFKNKYDPENKYFTVFQVALKSVD